MVRTVWIGLVCLIAICGLATYKIGFAAPARNQAASAGAATGAAATVIASAADAVAIKDAPVATKETPVGKTDRLDVDYLQDVPDKTLVHTIPIVLSDPATKVEPAKPTPEKATRIIARHWRSSYARFTRRHFHHRRELARPAREAKGSRVGASFTPMPAAM